MATGGATISNFIKEFGETDLYKFLGVSTDSNVKEITSAYRKTALKYHPDKNSDEASSAMFRKLTSVYSLLTDVTARAAYDNLLMVRLAADKRKLEFTAKRRKLVEDLERREREGAVANVGEVVAMRKMDEEIARLRKEGEARLKAETEILRTEMNRKDEGTCILRLRWKNREDNACVYNKDNLTQMFSKYGDCTVVISEKKGRAVVELNSGPWTYQAINEIGLAENELKTEWLRKPVIYNNTTLSDTLSARDYESLTLMKMRQAEERKRIVEKIQKEEHTTI